MGSERNCLTDWRRTHSHANHFRSHSMLINRGLFPPNDARADLKCGIQNILEPKIESTGKRDRGKFLSYQGIQIPDDRLLGAMAAPRLFQTLNTRLEPSSFAYEMWQTQGARRATTAALRESPR